MRHTLKALAVAAILTGVATFGADASPLPSETRLAAETPLTEQVSFRRAQWRQASPCRPGGRYYTYRGGWGCDYYLYGLWPARPPRRW